MSARAPDLGARSALFPADDVTRAYLRAQNRESEWKRLGIDSDVAPEPDLQVDLSAIEPMYAPLERPAAARRCRDSGEPQVAAIEVGVEASIGDVERIVRSLDGRSVAPGLAFEVVPGSRQLMETARERGLVDRLVAAGVRVMEVGTRSSLPVLPGARAIGLCFGVRPEDGNVRRGRWFASSPETCAAAGLSGRLVDPRSAEIRLESIPEMERYEMTSSWILRHDAEIVPDRGEAVTPNVLMAGAHAADEHALGVPTGVGIDAPLRGVVLIDVGDGVHAEQILPWGARLRPLIRNVSRLGDYVMVPVDPDFPRRARSAGGGIVVAGAAHGHGVSRDPIALALMALGVRTVIAVSFGDEYHRQLLNSGVLPLRFAVAADRNDIGVGDELEIPGLPDGMEPGFPLVARNLTRGTQFTVKHDLNRREIATVLAGGLLRRAMGGAS
jgi:aconitate hydratase